MRNIVLLSLFIFSTALSAQRPLAVDRGKILKEPNKKLLWGGEDPSMHFNITNCELKDEQFHYGIGREKFPALLEPAFISVKKADKKWKEEDRFLVAKIGNSVRAYSIEDLTRHEVVNDVINGRPVFAAYCVLADLGAMYDRNIGGREFTFALSGYTYFDPEIWEGMDGFVMWDRETESLWWPLIGRAVSGKMKNTPMKVLDESLWKQTTWKDVKENFPTAFVLKSGQDFERPVKWPRRYTEINNVETDGKSVAPKWGENNELKN
ncbi:MAG: DUF3179 domain-containing (seleno)protein [Bacteroidota bacterium]